MNNIVNKASPIVKRYYIHTFWQILPDFFDLLFYPFHHGTAIFTLEHHGNTCNYLSLTVPGDCPITYLRPHYHIRNIFYINGSTLCCRMNNDIFNILYGIDKTYSPYEILFRGMFYILSTSIGIIGSQGIKDLPEGNIVSDKLFWVH